MPYIICRQCVFCDFIRIPVWKIEVGPMDCFNVDLIYRVYTDYPAIKGMSKPGDIDLELSSFLLAENYNYRRCI